MNYIQIVGKYIKLVAEVTIQLSHLIDVRISCIYVVTIRVFGIYSAMI